MTKKPKKKLSYTKEAVQQRYLEKIHEREKKMREELAEYRLKIRRKKELEQAKKRDKIYKSTFNPHQEKLEKNINKILEERSRYGSPLRKIGAAMNLTGERVRQIVKNSMTKEERAYFNSFPIIRKEYPKSVKEITCACGKKLTIPSNSIRKHCNRDCARISMTRKYMFTKTALPKNKRQGWLWHNDPKYRAIHRKRMHDQWVRNKSNPVWLKQHNERQKVLFKRCQEKRMYGYAKTPLPPLP